MNYEYQKTNREKRQSPKHGEGWCGGCDKVIISYNGIKCYKCGYINGVRRFKKDK
jgi:hypothetical protein